MVSVWRVEPGKSVGTPEDDADEGLLGGWHKILELELAMQTNAISSALSDDGNWLVISDRYETKLFHLIHSVSQISPSYKNVTD
jgi:U3 small nucleolar RNA-associated protein 4